MANLLQAMLSEALEEFEMKFANLLACFDAVKTYQAMSSLVMLQDGGLPKPIVDALEKGNSEPHLKYQAKIFLTLLRRGAFNGFQEIKPLSTEANAELDQLEIVAGEKVAAPKPDHRKAENDLLAECVADYKGGIDGRHFQAKWMKDPQRRQVYESACARGLV